MKLYIFDVLCDTNIMLAWVKHTHFKHLLIIYNKIFKILYSNFFKNMHCTDDWIKCLPQTWGPEFGSLTLL